MRIGINLRIAVWLVLTTPLISVGLSAQSSSFQEFRASILKDYSDFRKGILADYDKFLDGIWEDYESFRGVERYDRPKPATIPVVENPDATPAEPVDMPAPEQENVTPQTTPQHSTPSLPPATTVPPSVASRPEDYSFRFFDISTKGVKPEMKLRKIQSQSDFGQQWRDLSKSPDANALIKSLSATARQYGLNDYLTYELVSAYINSAYSAESQLARHALAHYILANMGYDVRLALINNNKAVLLIALDGMVYGRPYMNVDGSRYHVFELGEADGRALGAGSVTTCRLPGDANKGRKMNMVIGKLTLPENPVEYTLEGGDLKVTGVTNGYLRSILYRYPQMSMDGYAKSELLPEVRASIVSQLREQLAGEEPLKAIDRLLQFCQNVTEYATDEVYHGFEKPYFMEEMLIYPKSDCEDRAILYTYLLKNVLDRENQLIAYPNHESVSVRLDESGRGDSYDYSGKRFYISDPTYIGAHTGMCMPAYKKTQPEIDYHYK